MKEARRDSLLFSCCPNPGVSFLRTINNSVKSVHDSSTFQYDFATATKTSLYPYTQFTNHESLPKLQEAFHGFLTAYPRYLQTVEADQVRAREYSNLSASGHVCLDYVGHGLFSYARNQVPQSAESVPSSSWMSPPPALLPLDRPPLFHICCKSVTLNAQILDDGGQLSNFESKLSKRIMRFFNISEDEYSMVFTANQTLAFRLVAEAYPFKNNRDLLTVYDHENEAVEAMITLLKGKGVRATSAEFKWPKLRICYHKLKEMVAGNNKKKNKGLFVFPLQSRVTGARYSYQWMTMAKENGWHVLLDMSALMPKEMDTLGLSLFRPDFLVCTYYKVFGDDPSGFCCLFIKKSIATTLNDLSIASSRGIVSLVPAATPWHPPQQPVELQNCASSTPPSAALSGAFHRTGSGHSNCKGIQPDEPEIVSAETSTELTTEKEARTSIGSVSEPEPKGMDTVDSLGRILINNRTRCLINWLVNALSVLKHPNSQDGHHPLIKIYGPRIRFDRAPALAINVFDWKSERVDPGLVQKLADRHSISLNVGIIKKIWFPDNYKQEEEKIVSVEKMKKVSKLERGIHVVTANLGFLTNFDDVYKLWVFVAKFLDADFVEKERWRYKALNQMMVEV